MGMIYTVAMASAIKSAQMVMFVGHALMHVHANANVTTAHPRTSASPNTRAEGGRPHAPKMHAYLARAARQAGVGERRKRHELTTTRAL